MHLRNVLVPSVPSYARCQSNRKTAHTRKCSCAKYAKCPQLCKMAVVGRRHTPEMFLCQLFPNSAQWQCCWKSYNRNVPVPSVPQFFKITKLYEGGAHQKMFLRHMFPSSARWQSCRKVQMRTFLCAHQKIFLCRVSFILQSG